MIPTSYYMPYVELSAKVLWIILRFFWNTLVRFAKTVGLLCILAGIGLAIYDFQQRKPMIESVRYRESGLLAERLRRLTEL